jgi:hypothetical protein
MRLRGGEVGQDHGDLFPSDFLNQWIEGGVARPERHSGNPAHRQGLFGQSDCSSDVRGVRSDDASLITQLTTSLGKGNLSHLVDWVTLERLNP